MVAVIFSSTVLYFLAIESIQIKDICGRVKNTQNLIVKNRRLPKNNKQTMYILSSDLVRQSKLICVERKTFLL